MSGTGEVPQSVDLTAFLATAECAILEAAKRGTEGAGESLISAGTYYAPKLLAAVEKVLELADGWDVAAVRLAAEIEQVSPRNVGARVLLEVRSELRRIQATAVREAITGALLGEGE